MKFLEKFEDAINHLLISIGNLFTRLLIKLMHPKFLLLLERIKAGVLYSIVWLKLLPKRIIVGLPGFIAWVKTYVKTFNFKEKFQESVDAAFAQYEKNQTGKKISNVKKAILAPFLIFNQWLKGLTSTQAFVLLGSTMASVLAAISIVFSSQRVIEGHQNGYRAPGSIEYEEEEIIYERPNYYKQQFRHLTLTNIRLPIYAPNINELKSIDIDFTATLSNRLGKMKMEKLEFQLRDHLISEIEPMSASFPLEDEGKEILRKKLILEVNDFLKSREIEGVVEELKITYILGN